MPHSQKPTIRLIAQTTGLSKATVANALNGTSTVAQATAERVLQVADELGYIRNPMVGALMSAVRQSDWRTMKGVLAVVEFGERKRKPDCVPFHSALLDGCKECAEELGFGLDYFQLDPSGLSPERLSGMLKARGIRGMVMLPSGKLPEFSRFDWTWLTGVYLDYIAEAPSLNFVCCDQYRTMLEALEKLWTMGYRRPGLVFEDGWEERIHMRLSAALRTFQASRKDVYPIDPELMQKVDQKGVLAWLEEKSPDVVLANGGTAVMEMIQSSGREIPRDVGFFCLNIAKARQKVAGLDLRPREIGRCAVEQLIAQVQREAWGRLRAPTSTTVFGDFVDGPTLRPAT